MPNPLLFRRVLMNTAATHVPAPASYTGPGDINGSALGWWGLRGFSAAYAAPGNNPAMDVVDTATGVTQTTINIKTDGTLDVATISALGYAVSVKRLYDQSGNGFHLTNIDSDHTVFPTLVLSSVPDLGAIRPAMLFDGSGQRLYNTTGITTSQPFTWSAVAHRPTAGAQREIFNSNNNIDFVYKSAANTVAMYAGNLEPLATAADANFHAFQAVFNDTTGTIYIDGSSTTMDLSSTLGMSGRINMGSNNGGSFFPGYINEVGVWAGSKSVNNVAMDSNQRTYWGF